MLEAGEHFVVAKLNDDALWDGYRFASAVTSAKRFALQSGAISKIFEIDDQDCESAKQHTSASLPIFFGTIGSREKEGH